MAAMSQALSGTESRSFTAAARQFHDDGFAIVRGLFAAGELDAVTDEARQAQLRIDLIETTNRRCRWQSDVSTGSCVFDAFDPITDIAPRSRELAADARIHELLTAVYGEPGRLFKDKLIFKPPGASGYGLHQDYIAWPSFPRSFLTVVVPIDAADDTNGCIEVFPGVHKRGCLTSEDGNYHEIPPGAIDETRGIKLLLAPGDVAIFGAFMPHRSGPNRSRRWRRQLYLSYNANSDGGDCWKSHYEEFHAWLRGQYAQYGLHDVHFA